MIISAGSMIVSGCTSLINNSDSKRLQPYSMNVVNINCDKTVENKVNIRYKSENREQNIIAISGHLVGDSKCESINMNVFRSSNGKNFKIEIKSENNGENCESCRSKVQFRAKIPTEVRPNDVEIQYYKRGEFKGKIEERSFQ